VDFLCPVIRCPAPSKRRQASAGGRLLPVSPRPSAAANLIPLYCCRKKLSSFVEYPSVFFLRPALLSGQVVLPSAAAVLHARQRMLCDPAILLGHFMGHGSFIGSFCIQSKILLMHLMNSALIEQNSPSQVQKAIFSRVPAKFCLTKTYRKTTFDLRETNNIEYYRLLELAKIIYTQIGLNYLTRHCLFGSSMTSQNPSFIELNRNLTSANHLFLSPFRILPVPKQSISSIYFSACSKFTNE
jgi:hypothetical protein